MNRYAGVLALLTALAVTSSCSKKKVNTSDLEKAFQATEASLPTAEASTASPSQAPEVPLRAFVEQASQAIKGNDYAGAIIPLQALRSQPNLTAEQLTTVQDTMAAVQTELALKADRGDPAAQRALDQIRQSKRAFRQR
jgi:Tfp pilus assembly protein PilX